MLSANREYMCVFIYIKTMILDQQDRLLRKNRYPYIYVYVDYLPYQEQKLTLKQEEMVLNNGRAERFSMTGLLLMDLLFLGQA